MRDSGIYQAISPGITSVTWLDRSGAEGDLMELNGWTSPERIRRYGAATRGARARRSYDCVMADIPDSAYLYSYSRSHGSV